MSPRSAQPYRPASKATSNFRPEMVFSSPKTIVVSVALLFALAFAELAYGGGSGLNTIVVVNQNSADSVEVGNYYCQRRQIPAQNVVLISWPGANTMWTNTDFEAVLLNPLLNAITNRQLDRQIYYVVLSMDIPFQTVFDGVVNSTTSALFYGPKTENGPDWVSITNSYFGSELPFELNRPASARRYSFLAAMITGSSVAQARRLIDRGIAAEGTAPGQPVLLEKSSDALRNFRYWTFDNAIFNSQLCNAFAVARTNCDSPFGQTNLLGLQTGLFQLSLSPNSFVPGAMADSLTSFGGIIFGPNDHTTLLAFLNAGACGSYGTVTEPSPMLEKFPASQNYFYQRRGFTIAECYYQSVFEPYEGLVVADPLCSPFRRAAKGRWGSLNTNTPFSGIQPLLLQLAAPDRQHPIQQVDLFVDGRLFRTITNIGPLAGEVLTATLNGYPVSYAVPSNASIATVAGGLASAINGAILPVGPPIRAVPYGDRIELQASTNFAGPFFYVDHSGSNSATTRFYRTVLLPVPTQPVLTASGLDAAGSFNMHIEPPDSRPYFIEASTNLLDWVPLATDLTGAFDFSDSDAATLPARLYRFVGNQTALAQPQLTPIGIDAGGSFQLRVQNSGGGGCQIEASTDLAHWVPLATSLATGSFDFTDVTAAQFGARFYRAVNLPLKPSRPRAGLFGQTASGDAIVRIDSASVPYVLQVSTDLIHWTSLFTNAAPSRFQISVTNSPGPGPSAATSVYASRGAMMNSPAQGMRSVKIYGTISLNDFAQFSFSKTNGLRVNVAVTNNSVGASVFEVVQALVTAINNSPDLQGPDGVAVSDLTQGWFGSASFNLRARSPGIEAAALSFTFGGSSGLLANPASPSALDQNLPDLRPRNHLYVTCGATNLLLHFPLDTRQLTNGRHELACVAYEGTSVRTQSRFNLSVLVTNSTLSGNSLALTSRTYGLPILVTPQTVNAMPLSGTDGTVATERDCDPASPPPRSN